MRKVRPQWATYSEWHTLRVFHLELQVGWEWVHRAVLGHVWRSVSLLLPPNHSRRHDVTASMNALGPCCRRKSVCIVGKRWLSEIPSGQTKSTSFALHLPPCTASFLTLCPCTTWWVEWDPAVPPRRQWLVEGLRAWNSRAALKPSLGVRGPPVVGPSAAAHCLPFRGRQSTLQDLSGTVQKHWHPTSPRCFLSRDQWTSLPHRGAEGQPHPGPWAAAVLEMCLVQLETGFWRLSMKEEEE